MKPSRLISQQSKQTFNHLLLIKSRVKKNGMSKSNN